MNKVFLLIGFSAFAIIYFAYSEEPQLIQPEEQKPKSQPKQHHLTNAFANAKKHAVK